MNKKNIVLSFLLIECIHVISLQAVFPPWFTTCLNTAYNLASSRDFVQTAIQGVQAAHQMHIFGYDEQTELALKDGQVNLINHLMSLPSIMKQLNNNNEYYKQLSLFDAIRVIQLGFLVAPKNRGIGMNK